MKDPFQTWTAHTCTVGKPSGKVSLVSLHRDMEGARADRRRGRDVEKDKVAV